MAERNLLSDVLQRIARATGLGGREPAGQAPDLLAEGRALLAERSEAAALVAAERLLSRLDQLDRESRIGFLTDIARQFGPDETRLSAAISGWTPGDTTAARRLHFAAEPASQGLIRRLNMAPGATARLVALRGEMLDHLAAVPALRSLDEDFLHLFASWFNRGFLDLRRIDWSTPAAVLEKIISYEAVHAIRGWDDLRRRVGDADRRLFAFFHPAMPGEPLVFVEVALTRSLPDRIAAILDDSRDRIDPATADTAVFYSISNCHKGLRGISFGNFLIKQVVIELRREWAGLSRFVTLSPVPGLRAWAEAPDTRLPQSLRAALSADPDRPSPDLARRLAAHYLLNARRSGGGALDPVAHFHLGNGAELHEIQAAADEGDSGQQASWGVMVNYLYQDGQVEARHRAYVNDGVVSAATRVRALVETQNSRKRSRSDV